MSLFCLCPLTLEFFLLRLCVNDAANNICYVELRHCYEFQLYATEFVVLHSLYEAYVTLYYSRYDMNATLRYKTFDATRWSRGTCMTYATPHFALISCQLYATRNIRLWFWSLASHLIGTTKNFESPKLRGLNRGVLCRQSTHKIDDWPPFGLHRSRDERKNKSTPLNTPFISKPFIQYKSEISTEFRVPLARSKCWTKTQINLYRPSSTKRYRDKNLPDFGSFPYCMILLPIRHFPRRISQITAGRIHYPFTLDRR